MKLYFILNGEDVTCEAGSEERLSDILRDDFSMTDVRSDCRTGRCGLCLVIFNGRTVPSCMIPAFRVQGAEVITFAGFSQTDDYADIHDGFAKAGAEPCEFCRGAVILSAYSLLEEKTRPSSEDILEYLSAVFCRCHEPATLVKGVQIAAELRARRTYFRANK